MRRAVMVAVTVVGLALGGALPVPASASAVESQFVVRCELSHRAKDDPIVEPNRRGASHSHDFVGNATTNSRSTPRTLLRGRTTCSRPKDRSAYWFPSVKVGRRWLSPSSVRVYYESAGRPNATVRPIPFGLRMIGGDAYTTSAQAADVVEWSCGSDDSVPAGPEPPSCPEGTTQLEVRFPDCWNGTDLDSADHRAHVAYHLPDGSCPASHPVPIARLRLKIRYPTEDGDRIRLASGGRLGAHADAMTAWSPGSQVRLVRSCINAGKECDANA